jgi:hypothetical protein
MFFKNIKKRNTGGGDGGGDGHATTVGTLLSHRGSRLRKKKWEKRKI